MVADNEERKRRRDTLRAHTKRGRNAVTIVARESLERSLQSPAYIEMALENIWPRYNAIEIKWRDIYGGDFFFIEMAFELCFYFS